jgi:hypothetical protein
MSSTARRPAFSCRERAGGNLSKTNDLAREAVGCNAGLGGPNRFVQALVRNLCFTAESAYKIMWRTPKMAPSAATKISTNSRCG